MNSKLFKLLLRLLQATVLSLSVGTPAKAQDAGNGVQVTVPNGYANITVNDLRVNSTAGTVRWLRRWDGQEWKFNPQWESLSQSWKNLTGSQSADSTGSTAAGAASPSSPLSSGGGGGDSGCWVWVDEDWQPSSGTALIGGIPEAAPMLAVRTTPFNRAMGEASTDYPPPQRVSVDYASLCAGSSSGGSALRETEGLRRSNELYLGEEGRYAFSNRAVLEKRSVRQLPTASAALQYANLAAGQISLAPISNAKGYRWIDKGGDWIDYNTQGQVVAWGDKNDNTVWLVRDTEGVLRGVVDANGRVLYSLHYSGQLLTEIKDYAASVTDLARTVKYQYDANNRLTQVTDVRGNISKYDYDAGNHIVKITDPEGRAEQLAYSGDMVKQRTTPDGAVTDYSFEYDDSNKQFASKITGPQTQAGRRVADFTHNRVGKLVRSMVNGLTEQEVRYDTGARAEINTNARGFTTRSTRNEFDQVVQIDQTDGSTVKRSYSALHLGLTEASDELGIKTQYQYDGKGNLTQKVEAAGTADERVTNYRVNSLGQLTLITRKGRTEANATVTPDAAWQLDYDALGQISKTTDPEGNTRQYIFDHGGNLVRFTDPRGNLTRYEVDAAGNLTQVTDALGRIISYQYDKVGNVIQMTDARAKVVQGAYDAMNRNTQVTNPVGGVYKRQYNAQGLPIQSADEDGRSSSAEFDNFLRLSKRMDALGNTTSQSYQIADGSSSGILGSLIDPTEIQYPSFTQQTKYDSRERPTSQTLLNPNAQGTEGLLSSSVYDKRGQMTSETDGNGKTRLYAYNVLGQLTEATDSLGNKTRAQYDARGNLIQITDAKGNSYSFTYDKDDRVLQQTLPLHQTIQFSYDAAGNLTEKLDPRGNKTSYSFDAANRQSEYKQSKADGTLLRTTTQSWDANDNLIGWSDVDASRPAGQQTTRSQISYDEANRKTGESVSYPNPQGTSTSLSYAWQYSLAGKKTQLTWADGSKIGYAYSQHGELETVTIPGEGSLSVSQFKWTAPAKVTLPGGSVQERTLDGLLKLESLKVKTPGAQTVLSVVNTYGKVQELKTSNRTDAANGQSSTKTSSFQYDDEIRLTQASTDTGGLFGTATENFTLDAVGNRIGHSQVSGAWTYDANNRLTQRGAGANATSYQYDDAGNLTQKSEPGNKITQYGYDTQNRLIEVKDASNSQNSLVAKYGYDPLDRRLWKEQYRDKSGAALAQAQRSYYLYADEGLIAEATQDIALGAGDAVTAASTPAIATQYGPYPNSDFGTGVLFIKTTNSLAQEVYAYYHRDHLTTPVQATDKAGNIVWSASYNVFGQASITTPNATTTNGVANYGVITSNIRLPGQYLDEETGLHYNFHRYYDSATGRYVTQDPVGIWGGINRFSYVKNDPLNQMDPLGLITDCELTTLRAMVNKYGLYPHVNSKNLKVSSKVVGHVAETSFWTGTATIGTNPNGIDGPMQYSGSVTARGISYDLLNTAFHENTHQAEMNRPAPLSFFADSFMEKFTGGDRSFAESAAEQIMRKHPNIEKEFIDAVNNCRSTKCDQKDPEVK